MDTNIAATAVLATLDEVVCYKATYGRLPAYYLRKRDNARNALVFLARWATDKSQPNWAAYPAATKDFRRWAAKHAVGVNFDFPVLKGGR